MGGLGLISTLKTLLEQVHPTLANKYLVGLSVLVIFFIISRIFVYVVERAILVLARKTKTEIDDLIVQKTSWPISLLLIFIGVKLATIPLLLIGRVDYITHNILNTLIIITVTYIVIVVGNIIIDSWAKKFAEKTKSTIDDSLLPLAHKFLKIIIVLIGLSFILNEWDINVAPYLASLGIVGVVLGFAMQDSLKNVFGGISLILDKNFKVGDVIKLGTDIGSVEDIGLRSTKIKTIKNEMLIVPNGSLANATLVNLALPDPSLRLILNFGVEYGSDPEKVKKIVLDAVNKLDIVQKEPKAELFFSKMGEFALEFRLRVWIKNYKDTFKAEDHINTAIYDALNKHKIGIPFPTRTVYMRKE